MSPQGTLLGLYPFALYIIRVFSVIKHNCHFLSNLFLLLHNTLSALDRENGGRRIKTLAVFDKNGGSGLQIDRRGMKQTDSLRIRRMYEVLHVVDDALLEAFIAGQDVAIPPVNAIPKRHVQVQNIHFCVIHG